MTRHTLKKQTNIFTGTNDQGGSNTGDRDQNNEKDMQADRENDRSKAINQTPDNNRRRKELRQAQLKTKRQATINKLTPDRLTQNNRQD